MDNREHYDQRAKSPILAAILSVCFPGSGFLYLGMIGRGITYMVVFAALIVALVNVSEYNARAMEVTVLALMMAGFYIFQIIDSFNAAGVPRKGGTHAGAAAPAETETPSLFGSVLILLLGVLFQLNNLDLLDFSRVVRLWPLLLIALGIHIMLSHQSNRKGGGE
ncbi:MAG TPA: hypothetical protein ENN40_11080 [Candidatus Aminicenantes bacterium]|nr:hypothetical protein [Candidatus Aminicenantes bacterium]